MKIWTCGCSPRSGSRNAWTRIKNFIFASSLSKFWKFFGAIQMISCRDWWPWTKPGYITMTRRQSNNQQSGGIAVTPPQNIPSARIRWNISRLDSLGSRRHPLNWLSSKGSNYQRVVLLISAVLTEGHFEGKRCGKFTKSVLFLHDNPGSPGTYNPEETGLTWLPMPWSPTLISGSGTVGLQPDPWSEKTIEKWHFSSDAEVIAAA